MNEDHKIAWLAGILEGEAHFSLERDQKGFHNCTIIRIVLRMTDGDVVQRAADIMGSRVSRHRPASLKSHYKDQFWTKVSGQKAANILRQILPFMGARRTARINGLLMAWETRSTYSDGAKLRVERQRQAAGFRVLPFRNAV